MPSMISSTRLAHDLHETNSRLSFWLESLAPRALQSSADVPAVTPQQMAGLLSELMRAGQWLRTLPHEKDPELEQELSQYREHVERLRDLLPAVHGALLRERAQLEQRRASIGSAAAWARRSRETL